jgi:hypothetical protein
MQMYGLKREEAIKLMEQQVKVGVSQYEQGEQTKRTGMQVSAQRDIAAMESAVRSADRALERDRLAAAAQGKSENDLREIYAKSLLLQQRFPDVNEYLRTMKGLGPTVPPPQTAPGAGGARP